VFHGELAAFRRDLLEKLGGFPTDVGADDSHIATRIALMGYRAVTVDNAWCVEAVPRGGYHKWRIRRAQHLIQHLAKTPETRPPLQGQLAAETAPRPTRHGPVKTRHAAAEAARRAEGP